MVGTTDARTADDDEAWSRDWPLVIMRKCQNPERLMTMEPRLAAGHNEEMPERLMMMGPELWPLIMLAEADDNDGRNDR